MCNNMYIQEKTLEEQQRNRIRAIEHRHSVALATGHSNSIRHIIGRFGTFLVMLGTLLERAERREIPLTERTGDRKGSPLLYSVGATRNRV